jgi:N-acetylglucosamine-6-phosphate deacetylase
MFCFTNTTIITPARTITRGCVLVRDDKFVAVGRMDEIDIPEGTQLLNGRGLLLVPGFIDLQFNGGYGYDLTHNPEKMWDVGVQLTRYGVTSFLPTIITSPLKTIRLAQSIWMQGPPPGYSGPTPLGLHLEGPFLNPGKRGAHNPAFLRPPALHDAVSWSPEMGVRLVTVAPELLGSMDIIATLRQRGVVVSAGHSMATFGEARHAITAGIRYATHLFNAMVPLHHRKPGLLGAVLADERVTIGLIADGRHVHPSLVKLIWHMTGDGRLNLVTDAMAALGMADGTYFLGDYRVLVENGMATLPDGTLAGSILSLDQGLRNLLNLTGCSQAEALRTITTTPATLLGLSHRLGQIAPGYDADMVVMDPEFSVVATIIKGKLAYRSDMPDWKAADSPAGKTSQQAVEATATRAVQTG